MLGDVIQTLIYPGEYFRREQSSYSVRKSANAVLLAISINLLASAIWIFHFAREAPVLGKTILFVAFSIGIISTFASIIVYWIFSAGAVYTIGSYFFGANCDFRDVIGATGWAFLPLGIAGIINIIFVMHFVSISPVPETSLEANNQLLQFSKSTSFQVLTTVIRPLINIWIGFILSFAAKYTLDISLKKAIISAIPPTALIFLLNLGTPSVIGV